MTCNFRHLILDSAGTERAGKPGLSPRRPASGRLVRAGVLLILAALLIGPVAPVGADEVKFGGLTYPRVRVTDLRDGVLYFETASGREQSVPLEDVEAVEVDRYPDLAAAGRAVEREEFAAAAGIYEDLLEDVDEDHLKVLITGGLVVSLDRSGRFGDAVEHYLELVKADTSGFTAAAMPGGVPEDADRREELAGLVSMRRNVTADPAARELLDQLIGRIEAGPGEGAMRDAAGGSESALLAGERETEGEGDEIAAMIDAGQLEEALEIIEQRMGEEGVSLSRLLYQRGRCQAELGREMDAAVSFMRVVVHYSPRGTGYYVPSLIEAGKILRDRGNTDQARRLWEEARGLAEGEEAEEVEGLLGALGDE